MKITDQISDLVLELGELESYELASIVIDYDGISIKGLLELYAKTNNTRSREVMIQILNEAGYGWLAERDAREMGKPYGIPSRIPEGHTIVAFENQQGGWLSESEFMDLTPINSFMH